MRTLTSFTRDRLGLVAAALVVLVVSASVADAETVGDLRGDIPTGADVRAELAEIATNRTEALGILSGLEADLLENLQERDRLGAAGRAYAERMEALAADARELAVTAYIAGGPVGEMRYLLEVSQASDLSWRQFLLSDQAQATTGAAAELADLRAEADDAIVASVDEAESLRLQIAEHEARLTEFANMEAEHERILVLADAWDRAAIAIEEGRYGIAPAENWERLRFCESSHNYGALSPSGTYRGAYQFDVATWETVGGRGDPAAAPPEEQDARARELYARRGHQPWPRCGRFVR